ncbi:carboxylating nicotinate-nucleotide diphosphorylase [Haliangium ochraceum]|uniref:Probable nicotinate-nucleotide pyrophosphorylase [carboxylating] n=1 Tax=Haliangium ochraceum (strain DSM 14365 / JCM 11303 / SMP-2) TaxID=502025 RepID=D0LK01_HALO1|nr:carboxylating nicotinate-nucleotide diphosphorylase [Haliangium ochraceum]ACY18508.1 nicotinate-nucleotide pyrophosphorylase [Haliangium ochraceum DSM 14365]
MNNSSSHPPDAAAAFAPVAGPRGLACLPAVGRLIELALDEDLGRGDVTTESVIELADGALDGAIVAREQLVVCGLDIAAAVFHRVDAAIELRPLAADGDLAEPGQRVLGLRGPAGSVLRAERTALNFLQRLSGVATLSRRFAEAVAHTSARVVDTRKTTPGYRVLEKAAVRAGGCVNHRFDLGSGVLIKDNHIAACGSVGEAVRRARSRAPHPLRIEIEVDTEAQLDEALEAGADVVLLDNMSPARVAAAAERAHARGVLVEVSGGIRLDTVAAYAEAGADVISAGALTHSAPSVDLGLDAVAQRSAE